MRDRRQQFEAMLLEHRGILFKVARMYARDPHDLDDIVQEIALQLWRSFGAFDARRAKRSTWMYRIALNVAISHARRARRVGAAGFETLDAASLDTVATAEATQDERTERDQRVARLHAFIAGLDPLNRALVLLHLEDRSYAEIAAVLGISETNVATKLNRIRQKARAGIDGALSTPSSGA